MTSPAHTRMWTARPDSGAEAYVALFNTGPVEAQASVGLADPGFGDAVAQHLWTAEDLGVARREFTRSLPARGSGLYRLAPA